MKNKFTQNLSLSAKTQLEQALENENFSLAASILVQNNQIDSAIQFCLENGLITNALEVAINAKKYDEAEKICLDNNDQIKLAEVLHLKGELKKAADLYAKLQNYERAAKIYFNAGEYDLAAQYYERIDQFMNAIMCCQKSKNTAKQLELQVKAFEHDLAMANGDLMAVNVSRTMAIYAAKSYLESEKTRKKGLEVLKEAQALDETAAEYMGCGKYLIAAYCFEFNNQLTDAVDAFIMANAANEAIALCKKLNNEQLEIDTLKRLKKYYQLAQKLSVPAHYDEAIAAIKKVESNDPDYVNALELEGDIYCKQKNYKDASLCYESLFWMKLPEERICRIAFKDGYCYESVDDFQNALKAYQKVYNIDPNFHGIGDVIDSVARKLRTQSKMRNATHGTSYDSNSMPRNSDGGVILRKANESRKRTKSVMIGDTEVYAVNSSRYQIIEEVAHGGMGVVYKATDTILMRTVALKVLSQKLKDNQVALEYFMREARASAQLQHINIVTVYDIGSLEDGNIYMAMEYVEGKNLKQLVQQTGIFPTKFLIQVATHACRGLQYAHDNGIIHRDIKSSNMMIAKRDKTLKILDLGLAKVLKEHECGSTQAIGTPYYMSPEQVLGNEIDARSDIYSLGVTLFELATGVLPFLKGDLPYKHVHEQPPLPSSINRNINPDLEDVILKMMQKSPDDRYNSCNDVIAALKRIPLTNEDY